jgi:Flp pilus assembly protein TadG
MMRLNSIFHRTWCNRIGGPLAEMAMAVPLMLVLIFGTMEFASLLYQQHTITKGVKEAARFAARAPAIRTTNACPPAGGNWTTIVSRAQAIATRDAISGSVLLPNFTASTVTITVRCADATGLITSNVASGSIPVVRVTATVPAQSLGFFGLINVDPFNLTATHEEMGIGL